jgi:hypothetical protein
MKNLVVVIKLWLLLSNCPKKYFIKIFGHFFDQSQAQLIENDVKTDVLTQTHSIRLLLSFG